MGTIFLSGSIWGLLHEIIASHSRVSTAYSSKISSLSSESVSESGVSGGKFAFIPRHVVGVIVNLAGKCASKGSGSRATLV